MVKFTDLKLQPAIQKALDQLGFLYPTDIQAQAIPVLRSSKVDFHGQAQTGTGKTIAFGIPLIEQIEGVALFPEALVIAPTRELVVQIVENLRALAQFQNTVIEPIYGGVSMVQQEKALKKGVHIVVGTPGRLLDHLQRGLLKLHKVKTLVLDEADVMLDMGFKADIDSLLKCTPTTRNIWLFSATVKSGIDDIKLSHMRNPVTIRVAATEVTTTNTKQYYAIVAQHDRLSTLSRIIDCTPTIYGIVFTPTKRLAEQLSKSLFTQGYAVDALHGDMGQLSRNNVIKKFKEKKINLLVATDVAARGIDVVGLTHVINYALPREEENYVHRIGRTGRAGNEGQAITFIAQAELHKLKRLAKKFKTEIMPLPLPTADDYIEVRMAKVKEKIAKVCTETTVEQKVADQLRPLLDVYGKDDLIVGMLNLLGPEIAQLKAAPAGHTQSKEKNMPHVQQSQQREIMLNVGTADGISKQDVMKFLLESAKLSGKAIKRLRVILKRTYIIIDDKEVDRVALELQAKRIAGHRVQARIV